MGTKLSAPLFYLLFYNLNSITCNKWLKYGPTCPTKIIIGAGEYSQDRSSSTLSENFDFHSKVTTLLQYKNIDSYKDQNKQVHSIVHLLSSSCKTFVFLISNAQQINKISSIELIPNPLVDQFIFILYKDDKLFQQLYIRQRFSDWKQRLVVSDIEEDEKFKEEFYSHNFKVEPSEFQQPQKDKFTHLSGRHLTVVGNQLPPLAFVQKMPDGTEKFNGVNYKVMLYSSKTLNFTFDLSIVPGKSTGILFPNGTWIGLVGDLHYRLYDMSILTGVTLDRLSVIDFATDMGFARVSYLTSYPKTYIKREAIFYPYSLPVWLCTCIAFVILSCVFYASQYFQSMSTSAKSNKDTRNSLFSTLFEFYSIALEQAPKEKTKGTKILYVIWLFFTILMGTAYRSNFVSFLTFPGSEIIPENFDSLSRRTDFAVYFNRLNTLAFTYFNSTQNPVITRLRKRTLYERDPAKCLVTAFINPKTACIAWDIVAMPAMSRNLTLNSYFSPLFITSDYMLTSSTSFGLQKNSIYTQSFNFIVSSYYESGFRSIWEREIVNEYKISGKAWTKSQPNSKVSQKLEQLHDEHINSATKPLKITSLQLVFGMLGFGCTVSLIVFVVEILKLIKTKKLMDY